MKVYSEQNVYDAAIERMNYLLDEFEHICLSFSGGKDSSVMIQLFNEVCKKRGRTFDVLFIDLEAQYKATMEFVEKIKPLSQIGTFYHVALPMNLSNANSIFQPHWTCWDPDKRDKWVRDMPKDAISDVDFFPFFEKNMEFEEFIKLFPRWYKEKHSTDKVASIVGIRSDESLNRFRTIAFGKKKYKGINWITENSKGIYSAYPIYDWATGDVWAATFKNNWHYNEVYELLTKNGVGFHQQRICQPYGYDQRVSLDQWAALEPETWTKILDRVSGVNYGALYARTSLLGHMGTQKPDHLTWEEYAVFLLESIGLYSEELMLHYVDKICRFMRYYREKEGVELGDIKDSLTPKEAREKHGESQWIHWRRIARMIEKNDFAGSSLSYGITKKDEQTARNLKKKWGELLGMPTNTKQLRELNCKISN